MNVTKPADRDARRIAADTIVLLLRAGVISYTSRALAAAAQATRLTVSEIEEAYDAVARNGHQPAVTATKTPVAPRALRSPRARTSVAVVAAKKARGNERTRRGRVERRCCLCKKWLPANTDIFHLKDRASGRLSSMCRPCRTEYQRERYLSVRKIANMNAAGLGFILETGDDLDGLTCAKCDGPLKAGQAVEGTAELAHAKCEAKR